MKEHRTRSLDQVSEQEHALEIIIGRLGWKIAM